MSVPLYVVSTDTTVDLPQEFLKKNNVRAIPLSYTIDGKFYSGVGNDNLPTDEFYRLVASGAMPTTAQINPELARESLEPYLKEGKDVLHIAFSSGLSGSYNSTKMAVDELQKEYPERKIRVIDSRAASLGEGLMLYYAIQMRDSGKSLEESANWLEDHKQEFVHIVTVNDLNHLHRGGRVSKASAVLGSMLGIKPIIHVNEEGCLIPIGKIRGRKAALDELVNYMEKKTKDYAFQNKMVFICHSACEDDAKYVQEQVKKRFGIQEFLIHSIGPVIGSHTGCGTVALFFRGTSK